MKQVSAFFKALADETRLKMVKLLMHRECAVCELAAILGTSQPCVSQHLKKLRQLGLITERREAQAIYCRLNQERLNELEAEYEAFKTRDLGSIPDLAEEVARLETVNGQGIERVCQLSDGPCPRVRRRASKPR